MKTVTLEVAPLTEVKRRALDTFKGWKHGARISFSSPELLFRLMTTKWWHFIRTMTGAGPLTIRELARRLDRAVKAVHGDVRALRGHPAENDRRIDYFSLRGHSPRCHLASSVMPSGV